MNTLRLFFASVGTFIVSCAAFAEEGMAQASNNADSSFLGFIAIGAGIGMGLAALGGASGQGKAASAALEGIARNPSSTNKMFVPLLLSLALMESLVIFTFLVTNGMAGTISKALGF